MEIWQVIKKQFGLLVVIVILCAILAGVFEMLARALAGFVLVPAIGFTGSCLGSPIAWVFADAFLIPAYFHVKKVLQKRIGENS